MRLSTAAHRDKEFSTSVVFLPFPCLSLLSYIFISDGPVSIPRADPEAINLHALICPIVGMRIGQKTHMLTPQLTCGDAPKTKGTKMTRSRRREKELLGATGCLVLIKTWHHPSSLCWYIFYVHWSRSPHMYTDVFCKRRICSLVSLWEQDAAVRTNMYLRTLISQRRTQLRVMNIHHHHASLN